MTESDLQKEGYDRLYLDINGWKSPYDQNTEAWFRTRIEAASLRDAERKELFGLLANVIDKKRNNPS